ncbi:30S ribosomal protein S13 [Candidatus Pacearchaeota archaeon]|nr:30S ribosomal protein S13 [Candidatus Pacearchaeota archaeon]|tara:strand:- start:5008 stop:5550 length:543 start_codon:yes stop_codon:yes gene_type:complete
MAEEPKQEKQKPKEEPKEEKSKDPRKQEEHEVLIRIFGYDIPASKNLYVGLTKIKGVSWSISNAVCNSLSFPKSKKISELSKEEIAKLESFLSELKIPDFLKNRKFDPESGKTTHLFSSDLDMRKEFDIKKLRKIRAYKGLRHAAGLPVRGQRTRANFRKGGKAVGVTKKSQAPAPAKDK